MDQSQHPCVPVDHLERCLSSIGLNFRSVSIQINKGHRIGFIFVVHEVIYSFGFIWIIRNVLLRKGTADILSKRGVKGFLEFAGCRLCDWHLIRGEAGRFQAKIPPDAKEKEVRFAAGLEQPSVTKAENESTAKRNFILAGSIAQFFSRPIAILLQADCLRSRNEGVGLV